MRLRGPGYRGRLVTAMVATSIVTLAVSGIAVLSPLERRLRDDQLHALSASVEASRASVAGLDAAQLADPRATDRVVRAIGRRTGAHVVLLDDRLTPIADNDRDQPAGGGADARAAVRQGRLVRGFGELPGGTFAEVDLPVRAAGRVLVLSAARSLREVTAAVRVVRTGLLAGAIAGLVAALLLGMLLSARLVRRLRRLRDVALAVAEDLPGTTVPTDPDTDEVAELTRAVGTMRTRLERQEEARRAFVASASHELRTPLASLGMTLELLDEDLGDGEVDVAAAREQIHLARAQTHRLTGLARDLLDLSRLDSAVPLRAEPVELDELCRAVLAEFEAAARDREVRLVLRAEPGGCWASADPGGIARIVRILVENGLRFAPPASTLAVEVTGDGGSPSLEVSDEGPGVPVEDRERIFERFQRGGDTRGEGGFGLGLAIARELAQRMGGRLVLVDAPRGARFRLRLPGGP